MIKNLTGRIIKGVGGNYSVVTSCYREFVCQARGLFRKENITPLVGDFVEISVVDEEKSVGYLQKILPRNNELVRPRIANVDQVLVVCATRPTINIPVLDAFLINCEMQDIEAVLCINKIDLDPEENYKEVLNAYEMAGYRPFAISVETGQGMENFAKVLEDKTTILAGASGVGKSSILNYLFPHLNLATGGLSEKIGRGKHTTRHTAIFQVDANSFVVDSPGFSSLNVEHIPKKELQNYYPEFYDHIENCYYVGCSHITEHDCAVKEQIGITIHPARYEQYKNFMT